MTDETPAFRFEGRQVANYEINVRGICPGYDTLHDLAAVIFKNRIGGNASLLIAGAGTGKEIVLLAKENPGWKFTGFDISAEILSEARARIEREGLSDRVDLIVGDVHAVPPEGRFDAAMSMLVMHFLPDVGGPSGKAGFLEAIAQRLSPGAPFVLADIHGERGDPDLERILDLWRDWKLRTGMDPADEERGHAVIVDKLPFVPESRIVELLSESGFGWMLPFYRALAIGAWLATKRDG